MAGLKKKKSKKSTWKEKRISQPNVNIGKEVKFVRNLIEFLQHTWWRPNIKVGKREKCLLHLSLLLKDTTQILILV